MCVYITAVVPASALTNQFAAVVQQHRLAFEPCHNGHVQRQLKPTERYVTATRSVCDCGCAWFDSGDQTPLSQAQIDREVIKLRRKKWSEKKIARWVSQMQQPPSATKPAQRVDRHAPDWPAFLEHALAVRGVPYIGLVGHSYSGGPSSEELTLIARTRHTVEELRDGTLPALDHDVIHEFRLIDHSRRVW